MERILVSAYAVNPYKGSEDGTGWNIVNQIARFQKAIVITRENNRAPIEKYISENKVQNVQNLEFVYFDLPYSLRFWKRGGNGALLYFYLWQIFLPFMVRKRKIEFDIAHHLNFHNDWTPTFLWLLKKPLVWGPIGHHPKMPFNFVIKYGVFAWLIDRITYLIKLLFWKFDPFLRLSLHKADTILAVNSSEKIIHRRVKSKITVMPAVAAEPALLSNLPKTGFTILSVGRFVALKGFDITIRAFAQFYASQPTQARTTMKLILVGKGPQKNKLKKIAKETGIEHAIEWIEWVDKTKMQTIYQRADAFLFPSHEGAGMVIPEALSFGIPIICFDNFGPGELTNDHCAIRIKAGKYTETVTEFSEALNSLYTKPRLRNDMAIGALNHWNAELNWEVKGYLLHKIYTVISAKRSWKPNKNDSENFHINENEMLLENEAS